ncbi:MAG: peptide deformylase [Rickettsiales bacterium]
MQFNFSEIVLLKDPDERLRQVAKEIIFPQDSNLLSKLTNDLQILYENMLKIMQNEDGVGLAATQINIHFRAILVDLRVDFEKDIFNPLFMINPVIIKTSKHITTLSEGCLSVPNKLIDIKRPNSLICKYFDIYRNIKKITVNDISAKIIQHEIDHLNGKLIVDYL